MIIETANPEMLEIWGESENSAQGRPLLDVFPLLKGQSFSDQLDLVFKSGKTVNFEAVSFKSYLNGQIVEKYIDINFHALLDNEGKVDAVMATAVNVTEHVNSRKALHASEKRAQEYSEELTALNEEIQSANEELAALNEEYAVTNEYLERANEKIDILNEQLRKENIKLSSENSDFQGSIADLNNHNRDLESRNIELKELNDTITKLNGKLYDSEVSFSNIVSQSPVAMMLVKGDDYIVSMINSSMLDLLGKDEDIIGKSLFKEIPELKGQYAAKLLIETYETGKFNSDLSNPVMLDRNGNLEKGFFNFSYTPYIEDGNVTGVIDIAVEVTSQVLAIQEKEETIIEKSELEKTIRNSEQRLQSILETMAEGVGVTDSTGQLVYANPIAQQILGLSESTIKDRTYDDPKWQNLRLDGSPLPSDEHPMSIIMTTQKPVFDHEIGVQPPDRERMYISINAAPLFDDDGNLSGGIGTFMDVTTRRMISQGKDDFISIASHELKTPVTSLKATLQLLQRSSDRLTNETRSRLLDQSVNSLDKLTRLINDLLDTSRLEQGQLKIEKSTFSVAELFDDCCSSLTHPLGKKIIFEGDTDQIVEADNMQIGQVMVNFITNAIKYAPDSDIRIIAQKTDNNEMMISVQDSGPGIPEDKLTHLFDRYYRTNYQGQKFTGLGLGLYISSDIIKNHGGKIGVESELGIGTKFWFTIPL